MVGGGLIKLFANAKSHTYDSANHEGYANEFIKELIKTDLNFGVELEQNIRRYGDMIHGFLIDITLPEIKTKYGKFRWKSNIGEKIISSLELSFGYNSLGYNSYMQYGEFYNIWDQLTLSKEQLRSYNMLIGQQNPIIIIDDNGNISKKMNGLQTFKNYHPETNLSIPIRFNFKNISDEYNNLSGLPIRCMINTPQIRIRLEQFENLYDISDIHTVINDEIKITIPNFSMTLNWIFFDITKNDIINFNHKYIINNIQKQEVELNGDTKIQLNFKGCVKELLWTIEEKYDYNYWIKMSKIFDGFTRKTNFSIATTILNYYYENFTDKNKAMEWDSFFTIKKANINKDQYYLKSAKITANHIDIQEERLGEYYNLVQSYKHHSYVPKDKNIYLYNFSKYPETIESSGFLDFDRLDLIELHLKLNKINISNHGILKIYAITQDVLDFYQGSVCFNIKKYKTYI